MNRTQGCVCYPSIGFRPDPISPMGLPYPCVFPFFHHFLPFYYSFRSSLCATVPLNIKISIKLQKNLAKRPRILYDIKAVGHLVHALYTLIFKERWPSWSKAHDWKSCIPHKGIEGSNPSLSAKCPLIGGFFIFLCRTLACCASPLLRVCYYFATVNTLLYRMTLIFIR